MEEKLRSRDSSRKGFCLDLKKKDDADVWWRLRQYIQVDFLNETVAMEFIGVIMMMVLLCLGFVAFLNWFVNDHSASLAVFLLGFLSIVLLVTMCKVFNACVDMNRLWENDQQVLSRATLEALMDEDDKAAAILRAMQRNVEVFDNRQELFGLVVSPNLRNAWMLSAVTLLISSFFEIVKPVLEDGSMDGLEDFMNHTSIGSLLSISEHS